MAEQVSHNVVNDSESTGGSPLVDVAANQTTTASAEHGNSTPALPESKTDDPVKTSQYANEDATDVNASASRANVGFQATEPAAEPSAGDATGQVAEVLAIVAQHGVEDKSIAGHEQLVNGVSDVLSQVDGVADDGSSVDVSVNSDAEGSRGDASEQKKDEKHHTRTNSVKKPTTFSKVSVTKNFLAKSATAAPAAPKTGDKPSPVGTPPLASAAKPRLIAKTGTTLRDVQKARLGVEGSTGPDASKVWNKNRRMYPSSIYQHASHKRTY